MGTSTDYAAPADWGPLKGKVTKAGQDRLTPTKARELVRDYVSKNGGSAAMSSGGGVLGNGQTAQNAARNLAGFISRVATHGLDQALEQSGLGELVGKSVTEILLGIESFCGGSDGDIDSVDARNALSRTRHELCEDVETPEELEAVLVSQVGDDRLGKLLVSYFGNYLYEQFCRVFFQQLVKKHGEERATSFLDEIQRVIHSDLKHRTFGKNLSKIKWFGAQGKQMAQEILRNTLAVFE